MGARCTAMSPQESPILPSNHVLAFSFFLLTFSSSFLAFHAHDSPSGAMDISSHALPINFNQANLELQDERFWTALVLSPRIAALGLHKKHEVSIVEHRTCSRK